MIVYVVAVNGGGVESVWTTPEAALDAEERDPNGDRAYIAVRPTDSEQPTEESEAARLELIRLSRERHNRRAQEIQESRHLRRTQGL